MVLSEVETGNAEVFLRKFILCPYIIKAFRYGGRLVRENVGIQIINESVAVVAETESILEADAIFVSRRTVDQPVATEFQTIFS